MQNLILTSSFSAVAKELFTKQILPPTATVGFIATAGDPYDATPWIKADRDALIDFGYEMLDIDLKNTTADTLLAQLSGVDIIFVAGGNTTYLVHHSHVSGFHNIVAPLLKQGKMYIGSSAGSILAGPSVEPFVGEDLEDLSDDFPIVDSTCLSLVDYIVLPHYPKYSEPNDALAAEYENHFEFVKMTDQEYRAENI